jgi:hypothetical protein
VLGADIRVCMEFRGTVCRRQKETLDRFPAASPQFAAMRKLAMNFRAILFGADPARLDARLTEANALVRTTSGHSPNKLKTLKRSMFGKSTVCRAWLIPIEGLSVH